MFGAVEVIKNMPTDALLDVWEKTTDNPDIHIPTLRGWIMDELEERNPGVFAAWLDTEYCYDWELVDMFREAKDK